MGKFLVKKRDINSIYKLSKFIPAGPWDLYWRWKRYEQFLDGLDIRNPRIIELGSGTGFMTFRMLKRYGGEAVLLDTSEAALGIAKKYSEQFDIDPSSVTYVNKNLFDYEDREKFDIVHSQGLIEHFPDQSRIVNEHFRFVKDNGYVLILAPRPSGFYRAARKIYEFLRGEWIFGYENPLSTEMVIGLIRNNSAEIIKKKNFIFSMGCLSKNYETVSYIIKTFWPWLL